MTAMWAPPRPTTAFTLAQTLLSLLETSAISRGIVLPDRRIIYMSPIPFDCPLVAVVIEGLYPNPPLGDQLMDCPLYTWVAKFGVVIVRKTCAIPSGRATMPTPELMTAAAQIASDDADVLQGVVNMIPEAGGLEISLKPPAGELQAVEMLITLRADGTL